MEREADDWGIDCGDRLQRHPFEWYDVARRRVVPCGDFAPLPFVYGLTSR